MLRREQSSPSYPPFPSSHTPWIWCLPSEPAGYLVRPRPGEWHQFRLPVLRVNYNPVSSMWVWRRQRKEIALAGSRWE